MGCSDLLRYFGTQRCILVHLLMMKTNRRPEIYPTCAKILCAPFHGEADEKHTHFYTTLCFQH